MAFMDWLKSARNTVGDALTSADNAIDTGVTHLPGVGGWYQGVLNQDKQQPNKPANDNWASSFLGNGQVAGEALGAVDKQVRQHVPGAGFVLDLPNRSWDTIFNVAWHADEQDDSFGAMFNKDSWSKAWNTWGNPDHVTAGQLWAGEAQHLAGMGDPRFGTLDPLNARDAQAIRAHADDTWYGQMTHAAVDLTASFVMPGAGAASGALRGVREAKTLSTAAKAEDAAKAFDEGRVTNLSRTPLRSALRGSLHLDQKPEDVVGQLVHTLRRGNAKYAGNIEGWQNYLKPMLEDTPDDGVAKLATLMAETNRSITDPSIAEQVQVNQYLALMGSTTAKARVAEDAPLVAKSMQTMMAAPPETDLVDQLVKAHQTAGVDFDPGTIIDDFYGKEADQAELGALRDHLEQATQDAAAARQLEDELRALKPQQRGFDQSRLVELRAKSHEHVRALTGQLRDAKKAQAEVKRSVKRATRSGSMDLSHWNELLGHHREQVGTLEGRLQAARADRALFAETPLRDPAEFEAWRNELDAATGQRRNAQYEAKWFEAEKRRLGEDMRGKVAEANLVRPGLSKINDRLNDIFSLGEDGYIGAGRVAPSGLDRVKTLYRDRIGEDYLFRTGDGNRVVRLMHWPRRAWVAIGTPRARGAINVNEVSVGARELGESMRRSRKFEGDEIRAAVNAFIASPASERQLIVGKAHDTMLERLAAEAGASPEQARYFIRASKDMYGKGRAHLAKEAEGQGDARVVFVKGPDGELNGFDGAFLRSHLADTVDFIDPGVIRSILKENFAGQKDWVKLLHTGEQGYNKLMQLWKHGVLIRPGLGVRAMLDTGVRGTALIGAASQFVQAVNGSQHLFRNRANSALVRIGMRNPEAVRFRAMGLEPRLVDVGGGRKAEFMPYEDRAKMAAHGLALQKGGSPTKAFRSSTSRFESNLRANRASWEKKKPDSPEWDVAYSEYAQTLGASPTAKVLMRYVDSDVPKMAPDQFTDWLFKHPGVDGEYRDMVQAHGVTREEFAQEMARQVSLMFPHREMVDAFRSGKLNGKGGTRLVKKWFPPESRFEVPGPEMSLDGRDIGSLLSKAMDGFYRNILDKPDLWLARHPVYVTKYDDFVREEVKAAVKRLDDGESLDGDAIRRIDRRARARATQLVRRSFYDNTRYTGAHHVLTKISPFFMPFEDALMSWSRLLYDDPNRVFNTLAGLWNVPNNVAPAIPGVAIVDQYGNPVERGQHPEGGTYIQLPVPFTGGAKVRWRKDALNSIAQGGTWWLPGFGPREQIATTLFLHDVLPNDVMIDVLGTDNPFGKAFFDSMFLGGVPDDASFKTQATNLVPSWARNMFNDTWGTGYGQHVGYLINKQYMESQKNGTRFNEQKAFNEATKQARTAGIVRMLSSGLFGMSGSAVLDGQFYVDQMHALDALTPAQLKQMGYDNPQEAFADKFPEAADLKWSMSKNETGINATVDAAKEAVKVNSLIEKYPDQGWFVVGSANVGGEFSRVAYNQQIGDKYGWQRKGRRRQSASEIFHDTRVQQGWDKWTKFTAQLDALHQEVGDDPQWDGFESFAKAQFVSYMAGENPAWVVEKNTMQNKRDTFFETADKIANSPRVRNRPDMVTYREYRGARQEVLDAFGLKSFTGTSANSAMARAAARRIGEQLAADNLGFGQAWDRMLSGEVEATPRDAELLQGVTVGD